jgi:hypothetical protein
MKTNDKFVLKDTTYIVACRLRQLNHRSWCGNIIWRWFKIIRLGGTHNRLDSQRHQPQSHTTSCEWHAVQPVGATVRELCYRFSVVYDGGAENTEWLQLFTYRMWCKLTIFGQWLLYVPPGTVFVQTVFLRSMWCLNELYTMRYEVKQRNTPNGILRVSQRCSRTFRAIFRQNNRNMAPGVNHRRLKTKTPGLLQGQCMWRSHICSGFAPDYVDFPVAI